MLYTCHLISGTSLAHVISIHYRVEWLDLHLFKRTYGEFFDRLLHFRRRVSMHSAYSAFQGSSKHGMMFDRRRRFFLFILSSDICYNQIYLQLLIDAPLLPPANFRLLQSPTYIPEAWRTLLQLITDLLQSSQSPLFISLLLFLPQLSLPADARLRLSEAWMHPQSQKKRHSRFWQARWLQMAIVTVRLHTIWGLTMELQWEQMMPLRSFTVTRHHYPCGTCWPHLAASYTAAEPWYQTEILRALITAIRSLNI